MVSDFVAVAACSEDEVVVHPIPLLQFVMGRHTQEPIGVLYFHRHQTVLE
jgi:hypothetical protein